MNAPDKAEHRAYAAEHLRLKQKQLVNKHDEDLQQLSYDDLFLQPVVKTLPDGQFVQDGDIWTESDWWFYSKTEVYTNLRLFGVFFVSATSNLLDFYLTKG